MIEMQKLNIKTFTDDLLLNVVSNDYVTKQLNKELNLNVYIQIYTLNLKFLLGYICLLCISELFYLHYTQPLPYNRTNVPSQTHKYQTSQ